MTNLNVASLSIEGEALSSIPSKEKIISCAQNIREVGELILEQNFLEGKDCDQIFD